MHWLVIGGGPSGRARWFEFHTDRIITSNRGLRWCANPDAYWITDPLAVERYRKDWEAYTGEIISNSASIPHATRWAYMERGEVYHGRSSGILACRVALERGATVLTLVGFNGHRWEDFNRTIDDKPGGRYGQQAEARNAAMAVSFADMVAGYPAAMFNFVGETLIALPPEFVRIP